MAESHDLPLLHPHRRRDDLPVLRNFANAMPLLPRVAASMKHLLELLLCGTIGTYCLMRCVAIMPRVIAEAQAVVRMVGERRREIEAIEEGVN